MRATGMSSIMRIVGQLVLQIQSKEILSSGAFFLTVLLKICHLHIVIMSNIKTLTESG